MSWLASFNYVLAFLPPMAWTVEGAAQDCGILELIFVSISVVYLLLCLALNRWSSKPRIRTWSLLLNIYLLGSIYLAAEIADLSTSIPFAPLYILIGLVTAILGLLISCGGYWLKLSSEVRSMVSLKSYVRAQFWHSTNNFAYFLIPLIIFRMPLPNDQQKLFFVGLPILSLLICIAALRFLLPKLFHLLGLEQLCENLPAPSRDKFLAASEPLRSVADYPMLVANGGLMNAVALPLNRTIVICSNLLHILDTAEVQAVLTHELGHLMDRTYLPRIVRRLYLCVFLLWVASFSEIFHLPGEPFTSLAIVLAAIYLGTGGIKSLRLKGEAFADGYVQQTDAALFTSLISGLEKLRQFTGLDKDFCKKYNYAHLDIDERIIAVEQGVLPKRRSKRLRLRFAFWVKLLPLMFCLFLAFRYFVPSAKEEWKELHSSYHKLLNSGEDQAALQAIHQALALAETRLGHNTGWTGTSLNDLAEYSQSHQDLAGAEHYATQALDVITARFGAEHARMIRCLKNLGEIHYATGELDSAADLLARALAIQIREGKELFKREETLDSLFLVYQRQGNLEGLARLRAQEMAMYGGKQAYLNAILDHAYALVEEQSFDAAALRLADALDTARTAFGEQSEEYADVLLAQAGLLNQQGFYDEAADICRCAMETLAGTSGIESKSYSYALITKADIQEQSGHLADAANTYAEILRIDQVLYGQDSDYLIYDYWQLGLVNETMSQWEQAESFFLKVAELEESEGDASVESRIETQEKLLTVLQALGKSDEAQNIEGKLRELRKLLPD